MSSLTRILLTSLSAGIISSIIAIVAGAILAYLFLTHMGIAFGPSGKSLTIFEVIVAIICLLVLLLSFFICPFAAYKARPVIFDYTSSIFLRVVFFGLIALSQIIILTTAHYSTVFIYSYKEEKAKQKRAEEMAPIIELQNKLDSADVKVSINKSKILSDNGKVITAELTLQIENVPFIIPSYELHIFGVPEDGGFLAPFQLPSDPQRRNPWIKVVDQNGKWVFQDIQTGAIISENSNEITLKVEYMRITAPKDKLPTVISPQLGIWTLQGNSYRGDHLIFSKPIPVKFD